jgi:hypothetical protein
MLSCCDPEKLMKVSELAGNRYKGIKVKFKTTKKAQNHR